MWGAVIGASTAAGPIVGGLLVQHIGWEACFYVNVPVSAAALAMSLLVVRETPAAPASSFDIPGIAALAGALFTLIFGLIKGQDYGWASARTLAFLGAAALLGLLFIIRERRARQPILPLRLFRSASLSAGVLLVILLMFALFGAMFFMTFYLENVHGLDPIQAGVHLLPMTAMLIVGSPAAGTLINKLGPRLPIVTGMAMAAVAMYGLSRLGAASSPNDTIIWFVLLGLGLAPVMVGATNVIVGNAPAQLAGVAGGLQSTAMQLGGAFGTAVLGAIMSARIDSLLPASWHAAHLPPLTAAGYAQVKSAVSVGVAPVTHQHPGAGGRRDHPDQPRHLHRRDAQRLPGRRRRRTRRSRHRPDHQARHRHRRSARRHLTPAQPQPTPLTTLNPEGRTSCPPCPPARR